MHRILSRFVAAAMLRCSSLPTWTTPFVVVGLVVFCASSLHAQNACTALPVCDSVFVQPNINQGGSAFPPSSCLRSIRNPVWYRVRIARDGFLGFLVELAPEDQRDDYDFAVFDATGGKTCDDLTLFDERSCNYADKTGNTGANGVGESNTANSRGSSFNARIPVKAGEEYLILISNYLASATSKGYRLSFASSDAGVIDRTGGMMNTPSSQVMSVEFPQGTCRVNTVTVRFSREIRCASLLNDTFVLRNENNAAQSEIPCRIRPDTRCERSAQNYVQSVVLELATPLTRSARTTLRTAKPVLDLCGNALTLSTTAEVRIAEEPLAVRVGGYDYVCAGGSAYLFADIPSVSNLNRCTFEWSKNGVVIPDERRNFLLAREVAEYRVFVEDTVSGCAGGGVLQVKDGNTFKPRINAATFTICAGDSVRLDAGADLENIQWFFRGFPLGNSRERYLWVSSGGAYSVQASRNGCTATSDAVNVSISPVPMLSQNMELFKVEGNSLVCTIPAHRYEWTLDGEKLENTRFADAKGQRVVPPKSGKITVTLFTEAGCSAASTLVAAPFAFERLPARAVLRIPDTLKAAQNQLVRVPIFCSTQQLDSLRQVGVTALRAELRMNARLLSLERNLNTPSATKRILRDTVLNRERRISIECTLPERVNTASSLQALDTIVFRAMLGNTSATAIILDSLATMPFPNLATLSAEEGAFTLTNISTRATVRLITSSTITMITSLTTSPNPAQERTVVSYEVSTVSKEPLPLLLTLTDTFGRLVYAAPHRAITSSDGKQTVEEQIDTRNLAQGVYILVLYLGAERVSRRVEVVR